MKNSQIIDKLDKLTLEADMLTEVLHDALRYHEETTGLTSAIYLSEIIQRKFRKIRALF